MPPLAPAIAWRLRKLVDALRWGRRGQVWFAVGPDRETVVEELRAELAPRTVADVVLTSQEPVWAQLGRAVVADGVVVAHVHTWSSSGRSQHVPRSFWQQLNLGRERRRREGWDLVVWFRHSVWLDDAVDGLPDLWSHRSGVFAPVALPRELPVRPVALDQIARQVATSRTLGRNHVDLDLLIEALEDAVLVGPAADRGPALVAVLRGAWSTLRWNERFRGRKAEDWFDETEASGWPYPILRVEAVGEWPRLLGKDSFGPEQLDNASTVATKAGLAGAVDVVDHLAGWYAVVGALVGHPAPTVHGPEPVLDRQRARRVLNRCRTWWIRDRGEVLAELAALDAIRPAVVLPAVDPRAFDAASADVVEAGLALARDLLADRLGPADPTEVLSISDTVDPIADFRVEAWRIAAAVHAEAGRWDAAAAALALGAATCPGNPDIVLDAVEIGLDHLSARTEGPAPATLASQLAAVHPPVADPLVHGQRLARVARLRARLHLAEGAGHRAVAVLVEARTELGESPAAALALDLDLAGLPAHAAPWSVRYEASERAIGAAREAQLLVAEGVACAFRARLFTEAGRAAEAAAAEADAAWIADRCPHPELRRARQ